MKSKKNIRVETVKEYFDFPKSETTKWGFWYLRPRALPWERFSENEEGWEAFSRQIRKEYPIQGFFREYVWSYDNPVFSFISLRRMKLKDLWDKTKCFFKPHHKKVRKALPKTWSDTTSLLINVNLAMIEDFHEEAENSHIDWQYNEGHKTFYKELKQANKYIKIIRPKLEKRIKSGYDFAAKNRDLPYEQQYFKVNYIEKLIKAFDEKYIIWAVKNKDYFWT